MTVYTRPAPKPEPRPKRSKLPIPRVNPERAAKREERDFGPKGAWVRRLFCCCLGKRTGEWVVDPDLGRVQVVVVAAHFPSRGAGGRSKHLVPLADHLHRRGHAEGEKTLERQFGIRFRDLAANYERLFQASLHPIERATPMTPLSPPARTP